MLLEANPTQNHTNNFDFLRLLFATLVLFTHAYIAVGVPAEDILWQFSHGQIQLSVFAVRGFFAISGYLILKSLLQSQSVKSYFFKRVIRLFPALWVVVGVTIVGGYFLVNKSTVDYFTNRTTLLYSATAMLHLRASIDGVFEHNPYRYHINGSLWTLPYEMVWYIFLIPLFFVRQRRGLLRVVLIALFGLLLFLQLSESSYPFIHYVNLELGQLIFLGLFFVAGAALNLFPALFASAHRRLFIVGITGLALLSVLYFGGFDRAQFLLIPPLVLAIGTANYPALSWIRKYGDISYGVYIWGFPVQQTLWQLVHPSLFPMLVLSIIISWLLGLASWHLLEKQALRLKGIFIPGSHPARLD